MLPLICSESIWMYVHSSRRISDWILDMWFWWLRLAAAFGLAFPGNINAQDGPAQKWLIAPKLRSDWSSTRPIHTRLFIPQRSWSYLRLWIVYYLLINYHLSQKKKKGLYLQLASTVTYSFQPSQPWLSGVEFHGSPFGLQRDAPGDCQQGPAGAAGVSQRLIWRYDRESMVFF